MKIAVDQIKCCGAGTCVMLAPEVFDQRDDDGAQAQAVIACDLDVRWGRILCRAQDIDVGRSGEDLS